METNNILYNFFTTHLDIKVENLQDIEKGLLIKIEEYFENSIGVLSIEDIVFEREHSSNKNAVIDIINVSDLLFDLGNWSFPESFEDYYIAYDIIPHELINEFMDILYLYLSNTNKYTYIYDKEKKEITRRIKL